MGTGNIIVGAAKEPAARPHARMHWPTLLALGTLFALVGVVDLFLAAYPADFNDVGQRFAALTGLAMGLPVFSIGMVAILAAGIGQGNRVLLAVASAANLLVGIALLGAALWLWGTFGAVAATLEEMARRPANLGLARGLVFYFGFAGVHLVAGLSGVAMLRRAATT